MKDIIFKGCGTAICTPFDKSGNVDFKELGRFIEFQINNKVDSIIVCGTTGESSTLSQDEKKNVIKFVVDKVKRRIPVIAGTGSNNTATAIIMTKYAESVGADGFLIVTPYYNKTTQLGLVKHYETIAQNTKLPIILYNVPGRTGVNIEPETCFELSKIKNIVAIKEASGNLSQIAKIAKLCGEDLQIYSGNDDQILPILSIGGIGGISVLSNIFPEYTHEMIYKYFNGECALATKMQLDCLDVVNNLFIEVNPIPVKAGLREIGFNFGVCRLPLVEMGEINLKKLEKSVRELGVTIHGLK